MLLLSTLQSQYALVTNTFNRNITPLNGDWNYIVDPYETGCYTYRYQAYEQMPDTWGVGYYKDRVAKNKSELVEYSFENSPTL